MHGAARHPQTPKNTKNTKTHTKKQKKQKKNTTNTKNAISQTPLLTPRPPGGGCPAVGSSGRHGRRLPLSRLPPFLLQEADVPCPIPKERRSDRIHNVRGDGTRQLRVLQHPAGKQRCCAMHADLAANPIKNETFAGQRGTRIFCRRRCRSSLLRLIFIARVRFGRFGFLYLL